MNSFENSLQIMSFMYKEALDEALNTAEEMIKQYEEEEEYEKAEELYKLKKTIKDIFIEMNR